MWKHLVKVDRFPICTQYQWRTRLCWELLWPRWRTAAWPCEPASPGWCRSCGSCFRTGFCWQRDPPDENQADKCIRMWKTNVINAMAVYVTLVTCFYLCHELNGFWTGSGYFTITATVLRVNLQASHIWDSWCLASTKFYTKGFHSLHFHARHSLLLQWKSAKYASISRWLKDAVLLLKLEKMKHILRGLTSFSVNGNPVFLISQI